MLDGVLGDHAGVGRGAAGDDDHLVDRAQVLLGDPQLVQDQAAVSSVRPSRVSADRVRLVVDLLLHEGVVAALLGGGGVPVDVVVLALGRRAVEADDRGALGGDRHDLVLAELERLAGVPDEGGDVGAEEVLAVAEADDQRAVAAGADDHAGLVGVHGQQREGARRGRSTTWRIASVRSPAVS